MKCATIAASRASAYPPLLPRKGPADVERIENDVSADLDCDLAGISIIASTWAIHPDDDDATLTLGTPFEDGLITKCPYSGGTAGKTYRIENRVQTSDGLDVTFTVQVQIAEVVKVAFGG